MRNKITILMLAAMLCLCTSCWLFCHTAIIAVDVRCSSKQQAEAREVFIKRAESLWKVYESTDVTHGVFTINYRGNDSLLNILLMRQGRIHIAETYAQSELLPMLMPVLAEIDSLRAGSDTSRRWLVGSAVNSPVIINSAKDQVSFIDSVFKSNMHLLPADVAFYWVAKMVQQTEMAEMDYELVALKLGHDDFVLNPESVKSCDVVKHKGSSRLAIELNEPYHKTWQRLTCNNIGKSLAVVIDGKVLVYLSVNSEIKKGHIEITGNFKYDDLLLIKAQMMGGELHCKGFVYDPS
ncbi:MAG: hypothetical protein LBV41_01010 [Cytophagaceae bacterium]|nr:hypothetical protein [Cytophagaceae bacterium]